MDLFVFDMFFVSYLLILVGGLTTTYCLWYLATREFTLSDKKRLGLNEFAIKEEERLRKKREEELKKLIIENYTEILKNQDDISKLQNDNLNEKD